MIDLQPSADLPEYKFSGFCRDLERWTGVIEWRSAADDYREMHGTAVGGKRITLRPLGMAHVTRRYLSWLNDPGVTRFMETGKKRVTLRELAVYARRARKARDKMVLAICDRSSGLHIGNIALNNIHPVHRSADVGIMIGDKHFWGQGYATEAIQLVAKYAFGPLRLHTLVAGFYAGHVASIRAFRKAGFRVQGRIREALLFEGRFTDRVWMGLKGGG